MTRLLLLGKTFSRQISGRNKSLANQYDKRNQESKELDVEDVPKSSRVYLENWLEEADAASSMAKR